MNQAGTPFNFDPDIDPALIGLFRVELENQTQLLSSALLSIEQHSESKDAFDIMLRAIHSVKGASRVVRLEPVTQLAHTMEDVLMAAKNGHLVLDEGSINVLFQTIDFLVALSRQPQVTMSAWLAQESSEMLRIKESLKDILAGKHLTELQLNKQKEKLAATSSVPIPAMAQEAKEKVIAVAGHPDLEQVQERVLHVTAESLNRLMGLAGESLVESRWLQPFSESLMRLKKNFSEITKQIDALKGHVQSNPSAEPLTFVLKILERKSDECRKTLNSKISDLDLFINRNSSLTDRLYKEVVHSRMRNLGDGVKAFPRMMRDLAQQLGKRVIFEIRGKSTPVDRDILELIETPLTHLLRNAIDHGIEKPEERMVAGKPPEGMVRLEAEHRAGMLSITVSDDGAGIDIEKIRKTVVERGLVNAQVAAKLTEVELIDFLYLPGFTTTTTTTEISGRGVGLDAVQNMIQTVAGSIHCTHVLGKGTRFNLQLPLTLSVIRALLFEVADEPYAIPLNRIGRTVVVPQSEVEWIENRQYFHFEGKNVGLISAWQILCEEKSNPSMQQLSIIIVSDKANHYGMVVDRFIGEKELVLQKLDERLGKVQDISSGAFMEDGSPLLIIDVEDIVRTIDTILSQGSVMKFSYTGAEKTQKHNKRILVIDDSITVREVECRLLRNHGYEVDTAINGMEGWNAVRVGDYDLVVTDVDMPRMNGIELVRAVRADTRFKSLPVMILSYKEREEDRVKGLEAGANYYLTKSGFHDQALLNAVIDLIGEP